MSKFRVQPNVVRNCAASLDSCAGELDTISQTIAGIMSNLAVTDSSIQILSDKLQQISEGISRQGAVCGESAKTLSWAADLYEKTDGGGASGGGAERTSGTRAKESGKEESGKGFDVWKLFLETFTAMTGPLGLIVHGLYSGVSCEWGKVISDGIKLTGKVVKNTKGGKVDWTKMFSLDKVTDKPFQYAVKSYTDFSKGNAFSTACNWAAKLIGSGFENFEEFHNFGLRFWEETVGETLLKVGEGVLITGGVVAAAAAAGVTLPGLAIAGIVAAGTVTVDWALNSITTWISKGSKTKWYDALGDLVIDGVDKAVEGGKKVVKTVWNGLTEGWNLLTGGSPAGGGIQVAW